MDKDLEKAKKKLTEYNKLVLENNYCDCNELNCLIGEGDKFCDGSKTVAKSIEIVLAALENSILICELEKDLKLLQEAKVDNTATFWMRHGIEEYLKKLLERNNHDEQ